MPIESGLSALLRRHLDEVRLAQLQETFGSAEDRRLGKGTFTAAFARLFAEADLRSEAESVYDAIAGADDGGSIAWSDFLDFAAEVFAPTGTPILELLPQAIVNPPHLKKDPIAKTVLVETPLYFCYAVISKYGNVGLYDGNMDFLTSYHGLMAREDLRRSDAENRRRNRWITDAIFLAEVQMLLIASSCRSLAIYDASGLQHVPIWLILGFPDSLQRMSYSFGERCKLFVGNERGQISVLQFQKAKDNLLRRKHNDKLSIYYYQELRSEKAFVVVRRLGRAHVEAVNGLECFRDGGTILSSSRDKSKSVVIRDAELGNARSYVFRLRQGASCCAVSNALKCLITGSEDGTLRIWNWLVPAEPTAVLRHHKSGIVDVTILETLKTFISCSRDGVLKVWNLTEHKCTQTVQLDFPSLHVEGKSIEWGTRCIYPGPKRRAVDPGDRWERDCIFVGCCDAVQRIKLLYMDGKQRDFDAGILSPPPLLNSVLIPKNWKIFNADEAPRAKPAEFASQLDNLKFILDKDVLGDGKCEINRRIAQLEDKKLKMRWAVEKCAPHLALDLHEIGELELRLPLPVDVNRTAKKLYERTQRMLVDAAARSAILSEQSSSSKSPRSSRSSIVDFDDVLM